MKPPEPEARAAIASTAAPVATAKPSADPPPGTPDERASSSSHSRKVRSRYARGDAIPGILTRDGASRFRVGSVRFEPDAQGGDHGGRGVDPFRLERGFEIGYDRSTECGICLGARDDC